jgi:hypothetical protein
MAGQRCLRNLRLKGEMTRIFPFSRVSIRVREPIFLGQTLGP